MEKEHVMLPSTFASDSGTVGKGDEMEVLACCFSWHWDIMNRVQIKSVLERALPSIKTWEPVGKIREQGETKGDVRKDTPLV